VQAAPVIGKKKQAGFKERAASPEPAVPNEKKLRPE